MPMLSLKDIFERVQLEKITHALINTKLDYSTEFGSNELREALVKNLYPKLSIENFIPSTGASEAIYLVMKTLFQKGDKVIVQKPIYQSLFQIAKDAGAELLEWEFDFVNHSWNMDDLKKLVKQNPDFKALIINNPNNPIGTAFNETELEQIFQTLDGKLIISDEVFQPIALNNTPSIASIYQNAVSISDLSKSFSMPGLRFGWIASQEKNLLEKFSAMKNYLSLRTNSVSEIIAVEVLKQSKHILSKNKNILSRNIDSLFAMNKQNLFFELDIKKERIAGLTIFPKLKEAVRELTTESLIQDKSIFLALGKNFGDNYGSHCRIGLGNLADLQLLESML